MEKKEISFKIKLPSLNINFWKIFSLILLILLLATNYQRIPYAGKISLLNQSSEIGKKTIDFINNFLVQPGTSASLVSVTDKGSYYEILTSYQGNSIPIYVSKDGKMLFLQAINMDEYSKQASTRKNEQTQSQPQIPKADKPVVELFVMSFCPFGNRAENTMYPVYKLLKDKVDWKIYYIVSVSDNTVSSLHGQPEVDEDEREACVLSEYGLEKWWEFTVYVNNKCGSRGECWEEAANQTGLDVNKIKDCVNKKGLELMKESASATNKAGVTGSPTLIINGVKSNVVYQYGNSEAYKQAICQAFKSPPPECSEVLESSTSSSSGGSCS